MFSDKNIFFNYYVFCHSQDNVTHQCVNVLCIICNILSYLNYKLQSHDRKSFHGENHVPAKSINPNLTASNKRSSRSMIR